MAEPGSPSAALGQITTTSGLGSYTLGKTVREKLPISAGYTIGSTLRYVVNDTSGIIEVCDGVLVSANDLSRSKFVISSTGSFINWPATGQRIVTPIVHFSICDIPPTDGQALLWNASLQEYCPGDVVTSGGLDDDAWDMQDVNSGTSV